MHGLRSSLRSARVTLSDAAPAPAPQAIAASQMTAFTSALAAHTGQAFASYQELHDFSVREYRGFWKFFAQWAQPQLDFCGGDEPVCIGDECEHARFFPGLRLNYAGSLLNSSVAAEAPALTACHADGTRVRWSRGELREGDRVVCVMRNDESAMLVALAVTALGASLSTAAPEMGVQAILDRFAPLAPRLLFAHIAPLTHSGKLSEAAARNAVNGLRVDNAGALRNPACLDAIRNHPALRPSAPVFPVVRPAPGQLEALLRRQWERRFGFAPIGLDDNFFELGGNSLLAARLLADVQQLTGRALPLATLLTAPTIRRLAALVEQYDESLPASPTLVPMREGTGAPLFLVHGLSGSVLECRPMVAALQTQRPVVGLQAPGLEGEELPPDRIEDLAARYVEQIRCEQPVGPYALVGYSFGGLVALEMAQQLRRAGESVNLLCLLDAYVHQDLDWSGRIRHRCQRANG